jgi:hypothetical protein
MKSVIKKLLTEDYLQSVRSYYIQRIGMATYEIGLYGIALDIIGFPDDTDMRSYFSSEYFPLLQRQIKINALAGIFETNSSVEAAINMHIDWLYERYAEYQSQGGIQATATSGSI